MTRIDVRRLATSAIGGLFVAAVTWLLVVPWDMSTRRGGRSGESLPAEADIEARVWLVLAITFALALALALALGVAARGRLGSPLVFWATSGATWIGLATWRGFAAEVSGANMSALWPVLGLPVVAAGTGVIAAFSLLADAAWKSHRRGGGPAIPPPT